MKLRIHFEYWKIKSTETSYSRQFRKIVKPFIKNSRAHISQSAFNPLTRNVPRFHATRFLKYVWPWLYVLTMSRTRVRMNPHLHLPQCQETPRSKQARNLKFNCSHIFKIMNEKVDFYFPCIHHWKKFWRNLFCSRSSRSQVFIKIGILRNFGKFTGKHLWCNLFLIKLQAFIPPTYEKETPTQVLFCEYCKIFQNSCFYGTLPLAVSTAVIINCWRLDKDLFRILSNI